MTMLVSLNMRSYLQLMKVSGKVLDQVKLALQMMSKTQKKKFKMRQVLLWTTTGLYKYYRIDTRSNRYLNIND